MSFELDSFNASYTLSSSHADAVILNPEANSGNGARRWKSVLETNQAREIRLADAHLFDGSLGLPALGAWVSEHIRGGARRFVAAGGDGTMNLVLNALMNAPERASLPKYGEGALRLGAIGMGSSNDFHKPIATGGRDRAAGLPCRLKFAHAALHDVGSMKSKATERYFIVNASVGVTAEANWNFNEAKGMLGLLKRSWVDGAIVATALKTFQSYDNFVAQISLDHAPAREIKLTNLGIVKNVHFSGQMHYDLPQAADDGFFGVHLCEGMSRLEMVGILSALNAGKFTGRPKTASHQARHVDVYAGAPFSVETDGEVIRTAHAQFTVQPRELFVCP